MAKTVFVGGGSYGWMPPILGRMFNTPTFQNDHIVIMDTDAQAAEDVYRLAQTLRKKYGSSLAVSRTTSLEESLEGADYVSLTISTGGLDAMRVDVEVPEKYGIYHTVGDTVGPGGMNRALRNIPIMIDLAKKMERYCPNAWLLNLSNPLTTLTRAVTKETKIKAAGLCQGVVEHVDYLVRLLGEKPGEDVQFTTAGIDHCPWLLDLKIKGKDGIEMLRKKGLCSTNIDAVVDSFDSHLGVGVGTRAGFALWAEMGQLPGIGDRHMVENFAHFIKDKRQMERFGIVRTSMEDRARNREICRKRCLKLADGEGELTFPETHAPVIQMVDALEGRKDLVTTLNVENVGQIPEFPLRANVETLCFIDRNGVHPLPIGKPLPRVIDAVVRPQIERQEGTIEAAMMGDLELAVNLLATDPLVGNIGDARAMLTEMTQRTAQWLPQFKN
jgi:alpha-galactosidase/6-phospho-beta-glucosidase family protein